MYQPSLSLTACHPIFKALGDEKRLAIIDILSQKDKVCVCEFIHLFSLSQSKLSYHLKILLDANLITKSQQGTWNYYSLNKDVLTSVLSSNLLKM
ncbi:ArsR/SmtB family transcription factor [Massilibacterium senegalense]|uniref:ArsR/SmtB family transcription factor n=1 Tax=Massilibacterium senegalense TaxID=1632858 RepID=UPI00078444CD|nr:metalloregulator ArsR/SmtB family transcription factor [Massilibacterium senegalense]